MANMTSHSASSSPLALGNADIIWQNDDLPVSRQFHDPYFSLHDGLAESRYVFLQHNQLPQRWADWHGPFCIVETGFGTGLNFLATWQAFQQHAGPDCWLHITSIEKYPLSRQQLARALAHWPELAELSEQLLTQYPDAIRGFHSLCWPAQRVQLTLVLDDVDNALSELSGPVHAWYLDGFAPATNPQMWQPELFNQIRRLSCRHPHLTGTTTLATFTAASAVRRGLQGAGFQVNRPKGFNGKREMLAATYAATIGPERPPEANTQPWLTPVRPWLAENTTETGTPDLAMVVVGAGLAGATTARALAERGMPVRVIDQTGIASGASGNPQGGLYVKLAANDQATHTEFYLQAYLTSLRWMKRQLAAGPDGAWNPCGVLQLAWSAAEQQRQQKFLDRLHYPESLIRPVSAAEASALSGSPLQQGGLFFPDAGWVSPADLCQQLLDHPLIDVQISTVRSIQQDSDTRWQLQLDNAPTLTSQQLVIATAGASPSLLPDTYLPIKSIRGQLSYLDAQQSPPLQTVLCGRSYMAPARQGQLVLGATYHQNDLDLTLRPQDHQTNLDHLKDFGSSWHALADTADKSGLVIGGRTGFRCTTPDYLPMAGPVVDTDAFIRCYAPMIKNAKQIPARKAPLHTGLWLNIGHGSRGLASTPLCAELLAAQITGAALPVSTQVAAALWPGRFLLRDMIRRKLPART
jgi:tRNA 5-methylaminomethyl-2-thiouridine biosynthesis bifunctional protein